MPRPDQLTIRGPLTIWRLTLSLRSAASYPDVNFLVVVNPNSGPGTEPLPGKDYAREVPRLNAFPNVHAVGYVRVDYCRKPLADACAEIDRYARWRRHPDAPPGLHVEGIYVDETPNHYSPEAAQYLDHLRRLVKASDGLAGERSTVRLPLYAAWDMTDSD